MAPKLTFIPERLTQNLVPEGLFLRHVFGGGILADFAVVFLRVAPQGIKVCHSHGFFDGGDVDR